MPVVWAMTSLESGQFDPVERCSELGELSSDFNQLRSRGQGYMEVRLPDSSFPQLTMGFRGDHAVIHLFTSEEDMALLTGDGTVPSEVTVDAPIMDDLTSFTGDFLMRVDRAWEVVQKFSHTGTFRDLGGWCEL
ncbi:hypothetical protein ACFW9L_09945 [Streptomyces sp. NPDC059517]|uniref:hypothetical protein n=1 Tax=Streptomyces sp. NPDC059517 TaxID=3346855 RepID=UPI00368E0841